MTQPIQSDVPRATPILRRRAQRFVGSEQSGLAGILDGRIDEEAWDPWFRTLRDQVVKLTRQTAKVNVLEASAAIVATPIVFTRADLTLCRAMLALRIAQAASVSGTVTLTLRWTDRGHQAASASVSIATNVLGATSTVVALAAPDAGAQITYEVAYASVGATPLKFNADVSIESVGA